MALLGIFDTQVRVFPNAEDFLAACHAEGTGPGCLLVAADLSGLSGVSLLQRLRTQGFSLPVIVFTNTVNRDLRQQAIKLGATEVIEKPLVNAFLAARLSELLPGEVNLPDTFASDIELHDGTRVTFRIMHPEDADIEQTFVRDLSARSKQLRFFSSVAELSPNMLDQFTHPHYPNTYALIATVCEAGRERQIAVVRYESTGVDGVVEFAVAVADEWQGFGIASQMLRGLTTVAAVAGIKRLEALVLRENHRMLKLARELGFTISSCENDATVVRVSKELRGSVSPPSSAPMPGESGSMGNHVGFCS